jgi:hypothetical protein
MLRAVVLLVLLANGLFFAWARGWLADAGAGLPRHAEREPQRLAAQVRPEAVAVVPPASASAAVQAARVASRVCLEAGPFSQSDLSAAEATLIAAQMPADSWLRQEQPVPLPWVVYAGRYPELPLRQSREADLKKLGLGFELITAPPELAPGLVLNRHASRDEAEAWLKDQAPPGLRGARVVQLPAVAAPSWRLRVANADADQAERLKTLAGDLLAGGFRPCASARP